ncbi:unnamed protein product [Cuscuta campestris]|uniref:Uncharacterized protein n=1 Tax=Cuscuta campestris TaxID=132261 RepID=A0A484NB98_9ASTE|nr:unnamed protein product [Cuscuta campestris]
MVPLVNLTEAMNAARPSRHPQSTPDDHCISIESRDEEWDIPRAHKKKKSKTPRLITSRDSAFERLQEREDRQKKSAKFRLGPGPTHVSAFDQLGKEREAKPARSQHSRSKRREPAMTWVLRREEEAKSLPRELVRSRLGNPRDRDKIKL